MRRRDGCANVRIEPRRGGEVRRQVGTRNAGEGWDRRPRATDAQAIGGATLDDENETLLSVSPTGETPCRGANASAAAPASPAPTKRRRSITRVRSLNLSPHHFGRDEQQRQRLPGALRTERCDCVGRIAEGSPGNSRARRGPVRPPPFRCASAKRSAASTRRSTASGAAQLACDVVIARPATPASMSAGPSCVEQTVDAPTGSAVRIVQRAHRRDSPFPRRLELHRLPAPTTSGEAISVRYSVGRSPRD